MQAHTISYFRPQSPRLSASQFITRVWGCQTKWPLYYQHQETSFWSALPIRAIRGQPALPLVNCGLTWRNAYADFTGCTISRMPALSAKLESVVHPGASLSTFALCHDAVRSSKVGAEAVCGIIISFLLLVSGPARGLFLYLLPVRFVPLVPLGCGSTPGRTIPRHCSRGYNSVR